MTCKWTDNWSVLVLLSALEVMNDLLSVQRRKKGSKTKSSVTCNKVVKPYNSSMGRVNLLDQCTTPYYLDWKSSVRFYLHILFDLIDMACVKSYFIYNMKYPNKLPLIDYKIVVAKNVIQIIKSGKGQYQCRDHLRGRSNLNGLIIMEDIYQITKQCENAVWTVQLRVKKREYLSFVWLVTFGYT